MWFRRFGIVTAIWVVLFVTKTGILSAGKHDGLPTFEKRMFIYQGPYDSLGSINEIADLISQYGVIIVTHGFLLNSSIWAHGSCLDVNYSHMPELLIRTRELNPLVKIFCYVSATADHFGGCWPIPSVVMNECPPGGCIDFKQWTEMWCTLEDIYPGLKIDGIFIDLVHPALIGSVVRDSLFHFVASKQKLIMANALSDTLGLQFVLDSPMLRKEDIVFVEGYYTINGMRNTQTDAMTTILSKSSQPWCAVASEKANTVIDCASPNATTAYEMIMNNGGIAFAYQSSDLGTQSYRWVNCPSPPVQVAPEDCVAKEENMNLSLEQNYPNPFNGLSIIQYHIDIPSHVRISIYNLLGKKEAVLFDHVQNAGSHRVSIDANNLASGTYIYRVETENKTLLKKFIVIK